MVSSCRRRRTSLKVSDAAVAGGATDVAAAVAAVDDDDVVVVAVPSCIERVLQRGQFSASYRIYPYHGTIWYLILTFVALQPHFYHHCYYHHCRCCIDGLYVLLRPEKKKRTGGPADSPKPPQHLSRLMLDHDWPETCPWSLSGPQFPQPTAIQQRYCYPKGRPEYSSRKGGALWTMYGSDGKEDLEYRLLHVYFSAKRAINKGYTVKPDDHVQPTNKRSKTSPLHEYIVHPMAVHFRPAQEADHRADSPHSHASLSLPLLSPTCDDTHESVEDDSHIKPTLSDSWSKLVSPSDLEFNSFFPVDDDDNRSHWPVSCAQTATPSRTPSRTPSNGSLYSLDLMDETWPTLEWNSWDEVGGPDSIGEACLHLKTRLSMVHTQIRDIVLSAPNHEQQGLLTRWRLIRWGWRTRMPMICSRSR
jgi:hypothetical protein